MGHDKDDDRTDPDRTNSNQTRQGKNGRPLEVGDRWRKINSHTIKDDGHTH